MIVVAIVSSVFLLQFQWFGEVAYLLLGADFGEKYASAWVNLRPSVHDPLKVGQTSR